MTEPLVPSGVADHSPSTKQAQPHQVREDIVLRADNPRRAKLEVEGWVMVARSWAASLDAASADMDVVDRAVARSAGHGLIREITDFDVAAVLELDVATLGDYPGGIATSHTPLTESTAQVSSVRRAFGIFDDKGRALGVTYVDIDGSSADTDFTVVLPQFRGLRLGSAVKAASVLALMKDGVRIFRTGGAEENTAILKANQNLGYVVDEEWVTLRLTAEDRD